MKKQSKKGNINGFDLFKSGMVTVGTAVLGSLIPILQTGYFPTSADMKTILITSLAAGVTYIFKQLATDENGNL